MSRQLASATTGELCLIMCCAVCARHVCLLCLLGMRAFAACAVPCSAICMLCPPARSVLHVRELCVGVVVRVCMLCARLHLTVRAAASHCSLSPALPGSSTAATTWLLARLPALQAPGRPSRCSPPTPLPSHSCCSRPHGRRGCCRCAQHRGWHTCGPKEMTFRWIRQRLHHLFGAAIGLATPSTQPFPTTAECRASRVLCRLTAGLATAPSVSLTGQRAHAGQHGLLKKHTHTFQVIRPFDAHGCALYHNPR